MFDTKSHRSVSAQPRSPASCCPTPCPACNRSASTQPAAEADACLRGTGSRHRSEPASPQRAARPSAHLQLQCLDAAAVDEGLAVVVVALEKAAAAKEQGAAEGGPSPAGAAAWAPSQDRRTPDRRAHSSSPCTGCARPALCSLGCPSPTTLSSLWALPLTGCARPARAPFSLPPRTARRRTP